MSADKLHLFATQYAFIDERLHEAGQAMLKFMLEFLTQYGAYHSASRKRRNSMTTTSRHDNPVREARHTRIKLTDVYLTDDGNISLPME